jgi:hypothetical protein
MEHKKLLDTLDKFIGNNTSIYLTDDCCSNKEIKTDGIMDTCINCGLTLEHREDIIKKDFLNPKYQLSTTIQYNKKYNNINRIHKWSNYDYKENMANKNYEEINNIGEKLNMETWEIRNACMIYRNIYIDKKISSRNKIKRSLFVYCLYTSCCQYNKEFDIIKTLRDNDLSIENYNKAICKIVDENKYFLNTNMTKYFYKLKNFNNDITMIDIIKEYNINCRRGKNKKCRLNNNSILIGSIYKLLFSDNDNCDKKFFKIFNITRTTIEKFNKLITGIN